MTKPPKKLQEKLRLDKLLVDHGHAASRERAQALILAGRVLVDEQRIDKPGTSVPANAAIRLLGSDLKYVSRGGLKLEHALAHWSIDLTGLACVDIGTSTGGFTDCMLQSGAQSVLAIDTGYGQIAQKLRDDPRVTLRERTNARLLTAGRAPRPVTTRAHLPRHGRPLPSPRPLSSSRRPPPRSVRCIISGGAWRSSLIKPQFEVGRESVRQGWHSPRNPEAR